MGIQQNDLYAGISTYHEYESYPIWQNHSVLEKVISLNFLYGDLTTASFLHCHHAGVGKFDKSVKSHVADSLEAMNVLLWIFLGNPWKPFLRDLIERVRTGDLKRYLRLDARTDENAFLIYHIHDAFCKISSLIRLDTARLRTSSDTDDITTLMKECQLIFTFIPSAEDDVSHSQRLFAFHGERRCDNINAQLLALKNTAKETKHSLYLETFRCGLFTCGTQVL